MINNFTYHKNLYFYEENSSSFKTKKLNIIQIILRKVFGCYAETHAHTVVTKILESAEKIEEGDYNSYVLQEKIQNIFNENPNLINKFLKNTGINKNRLLDKIIKLWKKKESIQIEQNKNYYLIEKLLNFCISNRFDSTKINLDLIPEDFFKKNSPTKYLEKLENLENQKLVQFFNKKSLLLQPDYFSTFLNSNQKLEDKKSILRSFLDEGGSLEKETDQTQPFLAIFENAKTPQDKIEWIQFFIDNGIDLNKKNSFGINLLSLCFAEKNEKMLELLFHQGGVDINSDCIGGLTITQLAAEQQDRQMLEFLDKLGNNLDNRLIWDPTEYLPIAIKTPDKLDFFEYLVNKNAHLLGRFEKGYNALMLAVDNNRIEIIDFIIDRIHRTKDENLSSYLNCQDESGYTALAHAVIKENKAVVDKLISLQFNSNILSNSEESLLLLACRHNKNPDILEMLLSFTTNHINNPDKFGETPLIAACKANNIKMVELLLKQTDIIYLENEDMEERTALSYALREKNPDIILALLKKEPNQKITNGRIFSGTPLIKASYKSQPKIVKKIIDDFIEEYSPIRIFLENNDVNVNLLPFILETKEINGMTPLNCAATNNALLKHPPSTKDCLGVIKTLLNFGAQLNTRDNRGQTPLHNACSFNYERNEQLIEIVKALLEAGAAPNDQGATIFSSQTTPLHLVCARIPKSYNIVKIFVDYESNLEARDKNERTPLHRACMSGNFEAVKALVESGANLEAIDMYGNNCLTLASVNDRLNIRDFLLENGANTISEK